MRRIYESIHQTIIHSVTKKSINLTDPLYEYLLSVSLRESDVLKKLRVETSHHPFAEMQIAPEQGQFMALLIQLMSACRVIEIGVYTGYSSICMAFAIPADGRVIACDNDAEITKIAGKYWREAGVSEKIDFRLGDALITLDKLLEEFGRGYFDLVFIDADKENYEGYYEKSLLLLRKGGLIIVDNVLWSGRPVDKTDSSGSTVAIRHFNKTLINDTRIKLSMLPVADGLTLALKTSD